MSDEFVRLEIDEPVATLTLDRQPGNQLSIDMMEAINTALLSLRDRPMLEILVIRGAGEDFCTGIDLAEHTKKRVQRLMQVYTRIFETLRMLEVISVAVVQGRAWGAGFELTLGCNLVIASDDANFALPETSRGLFPPIAALLLPRAVGHRRAMEWILTGNEISAERLEQIGFLNCVLTRKNFKKELNNYLERITNKSGPILQLAKRAQYEGYYASYDDALNRVQMLYLKDLMGLQDSTEGLNAAQEGREPQWQNR